MQEGVAASDVACLSRVNERGMLLYELPNTVGIYGIDCLNIGSNIWRHSSGNIEKSLGDRIRTNEVAQFLPRSEPILLSEGTNPFPDISRL